MTQRVFIQSTLALVCLWSQSCSDSSGHIIKIHDQLIDPQQTSLVASDIVKLADGHTVFIEGISALCEQSGSVRDIIANGLDYDVQSGRLYCLIKVFHPCGNDPVLEQTERVELNSLVKVIMQGMARQDLDNAEDAFLGGYLAKAVFSELLRYHNISWDESSNVQFP